MMRIICNQPDPSRIAIVVSYSKAVMINTNSGYALILFPNHKEREQLSTKYVKFILCESHSIISVGLNGISKKNTNVILDKCFNCVKSIFISFRSMSYMSRCLI